VASQVSNGVSAISVKRDDRRADRARPTFVATAVAPLGIRDRSFRAILYVVAPGATLRAYGFNRRKRNMNPLASGSVSRATIRVHQLRCSPGGST